MEGDAGSRHSGLSADHPLPIAFISHYALPHLGGIEVVIDQLARAMTARGHSVVHLAADSTRPGEHAEAEPPYEVVRVPAWNPTEMRWGVPYPLFLLPQLRKALRAATAHADVVHAHGLLYQSSSAA